MELKEQIKRIPLTSGVYLMKDASGEVIYIGKAVSLRKRVQSYFRRRGPVKDKTDLLVHDVRMIDFIETASEAEALILEASLIKENKPKYNIELRDDKSYPYIKISGEEFPRLSVDRPRVKDKNAEYFGPYVSVTLMREALTLVRRIFRFRTCDPFPDKECLDFHIKLCDAPCIKNISKEEYRRNVRNVRLVLEGKKDDLYRSLKKDLEDSVKARRYEDAAKLRDQLQAIGALYSGTKDVNYFKEAEQLQRALGLPRMPERIEAFDISNIMGNQAVGAMVSFLNGKPDKNNYRRFRIKTVDGIDDFKMISEVVRRRYRRLKEERSTFPDLVVIDGGKGQLSAACEELKNLDITLPVISLAKREEEIFLPQKRNPVKLMAHSLGLRLLQRVRDEAHRFAVSYHRSLRSREAIKNN